MNIVRSKFPIYHPWYGNECAVVPVCGTFSKKGLVMGRGAARLIRDTYRDADQFFKSAIIEKMDADGYFGWAKIVRKVKLEDKQRKQAFIGLQAQRHWSEPISPELFYRSLTQLTSEVFSQHRTFKFNLVITDLPEPMIDHVTSRFALPDNVNVYVGSED